jgi:hypothetical protein
MAAQGRHRRGATRRFVAALLLFAGALAVPAPVLAETAAGASPSVLLRGANIPRAKALALDAALIKGWRVVVSEPEHVVFEIRLDSPASAGPPGATPPEHTLLRIRADFTATPDGVDTALRATELWYAGTPAAWSTDVTAAYRDNLNNALSSLLQQWSAIAPPTVRQQPPRRVPAAPVPPAPVRTAPVERIASPPSPARPAPAAAGALPLPRTPASPPAPPPAAAPALRTTPIEQRPDDDPIGVWAYYAEAFATAQGCVLGERGAVLVADDGGTELHRVQCAGGAAVMVRCDREGCASAE